MCFYGNPDSKLRNTIKAMTEDFLNYLVRTIPSLSGQRTFGPRKLIQERIGRRGGETPRECCSETARVTRRVRFVVLARLGDHKHRLGGIPPISRATRT